MIVLKETKMSGAVVVLSGGQDSATCLFWARKNIQGKVHAVTFDYDQRHSVEVQSAIKVAELAGVDSHEIIQVGPILKSSSPLVNRAIPVGLYESVEKLPGGVEPTFIPGRNALFFVLAANRAAHLDCTSLVTGVCQEDFGGYHDCRDQFVRSMEKSLSLALFGTQDQFVIYTPLMFKNKRQTVQMAQNLPGCYEALQHTHTCYQGQNPPCLKCHACLLRARGFMEAEVGDPLVVACKSLGTLGQEVPDHGLLSGV